MGKTTWETMWVDQGGMEESAHGDRVGKRARSSSGEPCQSNLYPRSWESQTL